MGIQQMFLGGGASIPVGQAAWSGVNTQSASWTVPAKVTEISAVAIGAGGNGSQGYVYSSYTHGGTGGNGGNLAYSNGIAVTPGETLTIVIAPRNTKQTGNTESDGTEGQESGIKRGSTWLLKALGGAGGKRTRINSTLNEPNNEQTGGTNNIGDVVRFGGRGGSRRWPSTNENFCGGGGAAGYSGNGGNGGVYVGGNPSSGISATSGSGGGGGGGVPGDNVGGSGGGGVSYFGEGSSGAGASILDPNTSAYWTWQWIASTKGLAGSSGDNGSTTPLSGTGAGDSGGFGGHFGGGAGGQKNKGRDNWGQGGAGGVRIIHGTGRAFPSTRTANE